MLQRCKLSFFILKTFKIFFGKLSTLSKICKWRKQQGAEAIGVMVFASLWHNACKNRYVIHSLFTKKIIQVTFCGTMLPGNKIENDNSPRNSKITNILRIVVTYYFEYSYCPQFCSLLLRIKFLKLERNGLALCTS